MRYLDYEYIYCCNCLQLVPADESECGFCKRDGEEVDEDVEENDNASDLRKFYIFDISLIKLGTFLNSEIWPHGLMTTVKIMKEKRVSFAIL